MSRPLRVLYENAWYHVMNRGAGRGKIFKNDAQRKMFLNLLDECNKMFNLQIHAYCLMGNHYHILLSTPNANLPRAMRHLNGVYTQRYNAMMNTDGTLFKGRYKSQLVDEDNYLLIVSRYIHLNPVKANLVKNPADYKWSSYSFYLDISIKPVWLSIDPILDLLKNTKSLSHIKDYQDYVECRNIEEINVFSSTKITDPILGSYEFKEKIISYIGAHVSRDCLADVNRAKVIPSIESILAVICDYYKIEKGYLISAKKGQLNWPRLVFMYISRKLFGHTLNAISKPLNCSHRSTVSAGIHKCHKRLLYTPALEKEIFSLANTIKNII